MEGQKAFVMRVSTSITASTFEGVWGELQGQKLYPVSCDQGGCTFEAVLPCDTPGSVTMTFRSGTNYWWETTLAVAKPPECG